MSDTTQTLVLGPAATTDPAERIAAAIDGVLARVGAPERAEVAQRAGGDLPEIRVDLTGLAIDNIGELEELENLEESLPEGMEITDRFDSMHGTPGVIGELRIDAHPLRLLQVETDLEAQLLQLPIVWVEDVDGRLGLVVDDERQPTGVAGRARLAADKQAVIDAVQPLIDQLLAEAELPFEVEILQVQLTQEGENRVRAQALARASRGVLAAKARASAVIEIDADLVLRVHSIEVSSRNLVIAAGLKMFENKLTVPPVELRDFEHLGAKLQRATLAVGERIELEAVFG